LPTISGDERQGNYAEAALSSELERLRHASAGSRNDTLNKCAFRLGQLVGADLLNRGRVESAMASAAREIGLGDKEAQATIRSGLDAGMSQPRIVNLQPSSVQAAVDEQEDSLLRELASLGETDADNARRLARRFSNCLVCTPGNGFLTYDGQRWRRDDTRRSTALAEETARAIALEARYLRDHRDQARRASFANTSLSKGALDRMLDLAKPHLMRADKDFDIEHYKLNVENGTIDLRNGALLKHQSLDMFTKMAAAPYNPAAKCPVFMDFMRKILNDDDDCIRFLQKAVGYTLTGEITEQVLFVLQGPGATGKSTFINLIRDILGDYGLQTPTETLMAKRLEGGIPADLARLDGARMVVAVEANWTQQIDEARVKAMTGGEPIAARHLYGHWFQFQPACKIWLVVNDLPGVRGTAEAFWRRVRLVPFNVVIPEKDRDPNLLKKLKAEAAGILAWAVEGCIAWQREGLIPPDAVKRGVEDWQDKSDHVKRFCTDEIVFEHGNFVTSHDLFQRYQTWCKKNGEKPLDNRKLKGALLGCDLTFKKVNIGSTWRDVKLRLDG
jgi:putative DNA primase/helicase